MTCPTRPRLCAEPLEPRDVPAAVTEAFDATPPGAVPAGWQTWVGGAAGGFAALDAMLEGQEHLALGQLTQADVTAAIAYDFACTTMPEWAANRAPRLAALRDRLNADPRIGGTRFTG